MRNILLYGQGSYDNRGCEAIVVSTAKQIKEVGDRVISATFDYKNSKNKNNDLVDKYVNHYYKENELKGKYKDQNDYYKTIPFNYMNFEKLYQHDVIDEIKNCDICLSIGGDNYCYGYSRWLYAINDEIRKKNKKNVLWCASLFEEIEDDEIINDMKNFDVIMAREPITYRALEKYINKDRLMLVPDPAFSLEKKKIELPRLFDKKVIGINVSPLVLKNDSNTYHSVIDLIKSILDKTDNNVALIPHVFLDESNDMDVLTKIKNHYKKEKRVQLLDLSKNNCEEIKYVISKCEFIVAARTHASIAAYSSCVPTLVIGYSVKSKGIAEYLFGTYEDYVISYDNLTSELLLNKFMDLYNKREEIKKELKSKIKKISKEAKQLYKTLLNKLDRLDHEKVTLDSYCTGCGACFNICPVNAIMMKKNKEGFIYPSINLKKCINCGLCKKTCPSNNNYSYKYDDLVAYAAYAKTEKYYNKSSSGAIFPILASKVLKENGVVYGCTMRQNNYEHIRIDSLNKLQYILGSKYVQSNTKTTFSQVKKDIDKGKKVLYCGVPCQIEGLNRYLGRKYKKLYCISVICHGVPNKEIFNKYLKDNYKDSKLIDINFRYKYCNKKVVKYEFDNSYYVESNEDLYMKAFLQNYSLRNSCYKCDYKLYNKNSSDIILGDYWGYVDKNNFNKNNKSISAIIINSKKGNELFELIKEEINYELADINNIIQGNILLKDRVAYTKYREEFLSKLSSKSFNEAYYDTFKNDDYNKTKKEVEQLKLEIEKANNENTALKNTIYSTRMELDNILNSRKWKLASKLFDPIIKIISKIKK